MEIIGRQAEREIESNGTPSLSLHVQITQITPPSFSMNIVFKGSNFQLSFSLQEQEGGTDTDVVCDLL